MVSGTRPEIIKLAPLYHQLSRCGWARVAWLHTGQHSQMADQILTCFDIDPDISLVRAGDSLLEFGMGCRVQLDALLDRSPWACVIVQGDTESAFQGALAAFYRQIPVAHIEAGLRTHNLLRPFPEEGLRQMIGRIAKFHFSPTSRSRQALLAENVAPHSIWTTGNTVVDAQEWICKRRDIQRRATGRGHMLVTMHRRENWGDDIDHVCAAIADIAARLPDLPVLFPVHLNPVVHGPVHRHLGGLPNVRLTQPLDYLAMQQALADAWLVLTDSGGLQEEAPTFGVPVLVLREETERPEVLEAGCAMLVGAHRQAIMDQVLHLHADAQAYRGMQASVNPFGDGKASQRIAAHLESALRPSRQEASCLSGGSICAEELA
ncbi:UDP-N-acetylglucosamine 2-epimerase (non-hydrolysing) [Oryzisolibacter propanilivorax]|uniref:UDP-N-acetylglucosamine 2-epimerase (non-hydrolyzing) n=2 Tax=Oryzisolibacter propanilivorax TaxID=1527607 RepID=A0A1G9PN84_9BURK|nr:UDP-N-acetylglucosamine 2-epimerase (non-hydrolysing) [Oryzisolibacter propanilivorax]